MFTALTKNSSQPQVAVANCWAHLLSGPAVELKKVMAL
jgi:hypothetical protein